MRRLGPCRAQFLPLLAVVLVARAAAEDVAGSADHPAVARFKGSEIRAQSRQEFDAITFPMGPSDAREQKFTTDLRLEGKVTKTMYQAPAGASPLAVFRSYHEALKGSGFEILFQCAPKECDAKGGRTGYTILNTGLVIESLSVLKGRSPGDEVTHLLTARHPQKNTYVSLGAFSLYGYADEVYFFVDVVEVKPLESGLVEVKSAETMNTDIGAAGHSAVYGVFFDTGKAIVKPESAPTLTEIVKLLAENPSMKLHVVGHTDNTGTFAFNMTLSKQRADAVVAELVTKYKVAAARLDSAGVGSLSPVTTNRTEEGRAKNRRVELVEQ